MFLCMVWLVLASSHLPYQIVAYKKREIELQIDMSVVFFFFHLCFMCSYGV